jgi:arylsulfate sulfotransferase
MISGVNSEEVWYRYRVRDVGGEYRTIRDFGPEPHLNWAASEHEGLYELEVTARDVGSGEVATDTVVFEVTPIAIQTPVITPTNNPLVFLYSAPACPGGSQMRVQFQDASGNIQVTPNHLCQVGRTMNFYLAGMRANTQYVVNHMTDSGSVTENGPTLKITTGAAPLEIAPYIVKTPASTASSGILLQSTLYEPPVATDLNGNLLWYYPGDISLLTRPEAGGRFVGIYANRMLDVAHQIVREFDVASNTLRETNAARINEQLASMHKRLISGFHHEARVLPDGSILTLAAVEQILTDVQGPGPVDVIGDMILVLDKDLQVVWTWDAFDHLDPRRRATLDETCQANGGGCPVFYQASLANDWLHGNALQLMPDGNILYSARHQDWLIKINYNNGSGDGSIIWRLGKDGDFEYDSTDPYPWFSHQHDGNFPTSDSTLLTVFDNGNLRFAANTNAHSRGQVIKLDEANRRATLVVNADLGDYSAALGSAQLLPNGNCHFNLGLLPGANGTTSRSVEVNWAGTIVYEIQPATPVYRSFRVPTLYAQ